MKTRLKGMAVGIVLASFMNCTQPVEQQTPANSETTTVEESGLRFAYVNIDTLLLNYNYAKDLNEALLRKQEDSRLSINKQGKALERDVADFQNKIKNNAFLTEQRAQQEAQRLQKKEAELQELTQRLSNELMVEQQQLNSQLNDTIQAFLKKYNEEKQYELIISNTMNDNVLIAKPKYNITMDVVTRLNANYKPKE